MARQVWQSEDGALHDGERDALIADVAHWRRRYEALEAAVARSVSAETNGSITVAPPQSTGTVWDDGEEPEHDETMIDDGHACNGVCHNGSATETL